MTFYRFNKGYPRPRKIASGNLSIELSDNISYDDFDRFSSSVVSHLGGVVLKKNDSIIMCLWDVLIDGCKYNIIFDDYPLGVFLESCDDDSDLSGQQQTLDRSHPGQGHWEAGSVKTDPISGEIRMNDYGRPRLANDKSKVDYQ